MESSQTRAAFIMPVKIPGSETELRFLREAVDSIKRQTDGDWVLIMVDDCSDDARVDAALAEIKNELGDRAELIRLAENVGAGQARNVGIRRAAELGAPFLLYNDADDISDPRRLELVRKAFADETVNVVYTSFDVVDENGTVRPQESLSMSIQEILDGHKQDVVEGENAWVQIATRKNYTNQTSSTAVRTALAVKEPFPKRSVSEDSHTWMRYGAHPGKFVFLPEIKNRYRICTNVASRSRGLNADFYEQKAATDTAGFEEAMKLAERFGGIKPEEENDVRRAFYVRLALALLHGDADVLAEKQLRFAVELSQEKALVDIEQLPCGETDKRTLREMAERAG